MYNLDYLRRFILAAKGFESHTGYKGFEEIYKELYHPFEGKKTRPIILGMIDVACSMYETAWELNFLRNLKIHKLIECALGLDTRTVTKDELDTIDKRLEHFINIIMQEFMLLKVKDDNGKRLIDLDPDKNNTKYQLFLKEV